MTILLQHLMICYLLLLVILLIRISIIVGSVVVAMEIINHNASSVENLDLVHRCFHRFNVHFTCVTDPGVSISHNGSPSVHLCSTQWEDSSKSEVHVPTPQHTTLMTVIPNSIPTTIPFVCSPHLPYASYSPVVSASLYHPLLVPSPFTTPSSLAYVYPLTMHHPVPTTLIPGNGVSVTSP